MRPIYELLGLTVGCIQTPMGPDPRRKAYGCDITYGTAQEFGFDFLRDRLFGEAAGGRRGGGASLFGDGGAWGGPVQRRHHYAIVDEADSILIDEARTPLIISAPASEADRRTVEAYQWADGAARQLEPETHHTYDEEKRQVELTVEGRWKVRSLPMPESLGPVGMEQIYEHVERAAKVHRDFQLDQHYVVQNGEIVIVDEFTGRLMPGRKWRDGIHQAIEAKEGAEVTVATAQAARTTIQNYFLRYQRLAGMTGTAVTAARELVRVYRTPVVRVPTNRPVNRTLLPDRVYSTKDGRWEAVAEEIRRLHNQGRPVLIGTRSIDKSEHLSQLLTQAKVPHTVLNAKRHAEEAEIVAKAGQRGAVTIATNMAGRGTDITLGEAVTELGGLHVIGTERHDSERIDRQLAGRAGRQGDPGSAQFFLSIDDELLEAFGADKAERLRKAFAGRNGDGRIDRMRRVFRRAQRRVEKKHFKERSRLMRYEKQRNEMQTNMGLDPFLDSAQ
jgi:preprotein translocase subunit SecA